MAITSGLGQSFYLGGYDLSGDTGSADNISCPLNTQDITAISGYAVRRLGLLRDGALSWMSYFNPAVGAAHSVLSTLPTTDRNLMWVTGSAIGAPAACMVGKQIGYDGTRGQDGSFTLKVDAQANAYGLEWCQLLTAGQRTDTAATNGASYDTGASADFGAQAYLQVVSFTGTDVTITIEDSADDASFAAVTGLSFTAVTSAPTAERVATAAGATVRRYLRVATSTSGGFSSLVFLVAVNKNPIAVSI